MSRQEVCKLERLVSSCVLKPSSEKVFPSQGFALLATTTWRIISGWGLWIFYEENSADFRWLLLL